MASSLPNELIQSILLQTDPETYLAAHQTCRTWRQASSTPYMLRRALQDIPASLLPPTNSLTDQQWASYFAQIARLNLFGRRHHIQKSVAPRLLPQACTRTTVLGASLDAGTIVVLKAAQVLVYRTRTAPIEAEEAQPWISQSEPCESVSASASKSKVEFVLEQEFPLASSLYPHWTSVCRALMDQTNSHWSVNQRYSKHRVAVSSRGDFVAVALGRVIQVYGLPRFAGQGNVLDNDFTIDKPAEHVLGQHTEHIAFARLPGPELVYEDTDGVVDGLEFADDDTLLRVAIGKESTIHRPTRVRYLGCPDVVGGGGPDLDYWREAIKMVYLDSAVLGASLGGSEVRCNLRGLRLLDREVDVRDQWDSIPSPDADACAYPRPNPSQRTASPTSTGTSELNHRYFIASLHTNNTDTYCIGLATLASITLAPVLVTLLRLLPSIHSLPSNVVPTTSQSKEYPCLFPYPHSLDSSTSQSQSPTPSPPISKHTHVFNLQTMIPRFASTNLPSATFSAPLLAVSDDAQILVIYEPDHACCIVDGGTLYVYCIASCRSVYQPETFCGKTGVAEDENAGAGAGEEEAGKFPNWDIIPSWPFLLDRLSVDVESVRVKTQEGKGEFKYKNQYVITATAGDEEMEWVF